MKQINNQFVKIAPNILSTFTFPIIQFASSAAFLVSCRMITEKLMHLCELTYVMMCGGGSFCFIIGLMWVLGEICEDEEKRSTFLIDF